MKAKDKKVRVAIYVGVFLLMTVYQLYDYTQRKYHHFQGGLILIDIIFVDKEDNLYEILELESPYVSDHQINVGYDKAR